MTRILRCILALTFMASVGLDVFAQDASKKKVAVYMTGKDINEAYKKVIGAKFVSAITESGEYAAVERTADFLAALSAENDYQTSGEVRDSQIAALGQKFGVQFVAVADVSEVFDEYFIAARLINVETALVEMAYDTNGPAESMDQLVSLSKNIASGLFNGVYSSAPTQHAPIHLSLCVTDRNGKVQYITAEQWQRMAEGKKLDYTKKGVVIAENGDAFLVAMRDTGQGDWYWACRNCNLPSIWQGELISKYKDSLNSALKIFGGEPLVTNYNRNPYYWTNESRDSSYAWVVSMPDGYIGYYYKNYSYRARAVAPVQPSSAM